MAFTPGTAKFFMSLTYVDQGNNLSKVEYQIDAADIDAAETIAASDINDFVAVTKAYVQSYSVREEFPNTATRTPAGEVEEKAVLTLQLDTPLKKAILTIPAPIDAIFGASGTSDFNKVNVSNSLVLAVAGNFISQLFISDGEHATSGTPLVLKGQRTHRSSGRG